MEIVYHILRDDGTIWDSQFFCKDADPYIVRKEYRLYKKHMFPSLDPITGEIIESNGIYVPYKNQIYLLDRRELLNNRKDLPIAITEFFSKTLEDENWLQNNIQNIKKAIALSSTNSNNDIDREKIEVWFLSWMLRRFSNQSDFEEHFKNLKPNLKYKPGVVYGVVALYLEKLCQRLGWNLNGEYTLLEKDGKWNRILNYFAKFAPIIPSIFYRSKEQIVKEEELDHNEFEKMIASSRIKFSEEREKWWKRKREFRFKKHLSRVIVLKLNMLKEALESENNESIDEIITKLDINDEIFEVELINDISELYAKLCRKLPYFKKYKRFFDNLITKVDPDDMTLYKARLVNKSIQPNNSSGIVVKRMQSVTKHLVYPSGSKIILPWFSDKDVERICQEKEFRDHWRISSFAIKAVTISGNLLSLGSCCLYLIWYISTILNELWYLASIIKYVELKSDRETIFEKVKNEAAKWHNEEKDWKPTQEEIDLEFPIGMNLLEHIIRTTWKFCLAWDIDIIVGLDSFRDWVSLRDGGMGLYIDIQPITSGTNMELTLHYIPLLKYPRSNLPFDCLVSIDNYSTGNEISDSLRRVYIQNALPFDDNISRLICKLQLPPELKGSVVKSISITLLSLVYLSQNSEELLKSANSCVSKSITNYFSSSTNSISKSQERYYNKGKMPGRLEERLRTQNLCFSLDSNANKEFIKWLEKFFKKS